VQQHPATMLGLEEYGRIKLVTVRLALPMKSNLLVNKTASCTPIQNRGHCGRNQDDVPLTSGFQNNRFSGNVVTILLHPKHCYWSETP
jgi:hypothetical protein